MDYNHSDLVGNIDRERGYNAIDDSNDPMDDNGHGTHVAGTIGALGDNGVGVAGINWNVNIIPIKFLDGNGSGYLSDAVKGINYMVDLANNGLRIVASNNSWGGGGYSASMHSAIASARDAGIPLLPPPVTKQITTMRLQATQPAITSQMLSRLGRSTRMALSLTSQITGRAQFTSPRLASLS